MSDLEYTVENRFTVTLENLVDSRGRPSEFPIELRVTSPGHGDTIARQLEYRIRLAIYEAVDEFDEEIERRGTEAHRDRDEFLDDDLRDLVETWRHEAAGTSSKRSDGLAQASDELEEVIERHD